MASTSAPASAVAAEAKKVKVLLVGPIGSNVDAFVSKLRSLHVGKAGPFDVCFSVGPSTGGLNASDSCLQKLRSRLPLPVYLQSSPFATTGDSSSSNNGGGEGASLPPLTLQDHAKLVTIQPDGSAAEETGDRSNNDDDESPTRTVLRVADTQVFYLCDSLTASPKADLWAISAPGHDGPLLIASCPSHVRHDADHAKPLLTKAASDCAVDLLLTSDWPQGVEKVLSGDDQNNQNPSFDVAAIANDVRPRYHISAHGFAQSPPYAVRDRACRFLALGSVAPGKVDKSKKFVHALGLAPGEVTTSSHTSVRPNPFQLRMEEGATTTGAPSATMPSASMPAGYSRFALKRPRNDASGNGEDAEFSIEPPENSKDPRTLFLYGLHRDVTGELSSARSSALLTAFAPHGVQTVRHPPGSATTAYCFLEFADHQTAKECLRKTMGKVTVNGVDLTIKWGSEQNSNHKRAKQQHQPFVPQEEAASSTTLYFHPPAKSEKSLHEYNIESEEKGDDENGDKKPAPVDDDARPNEEKLGNGENPSSSSRQTNNSFANDLRKLVEMTLENSLNEGNAEGDERVTAATEPALAVGVSCKDKYGFLEFASHAAATMALAALTKHTDGGTISAGENVPDHLVDTQLRWARGSNKNKANEKGDKDNYLGFERKHFPADSRMDCWFCLASPTCERHLITGVYDGCYCAVPKGSVHPGHILIVPVTHSSKGIWQHDATVRDEVQQLLQQLRTHAAQAYDSDLFVFERAMQTRGGYHAHVQCVPVPRTVTGAIRTTLLAHAKGSGFDLRPVQSDLGVTSIVNNETGNDGDVGYFYAELNENDRYLYCGTHKVPLQFGREVLAAVLQKPDLAHWKSCVVDAEKEAAAATAFRESFAAAK